MKKIIIFIILSIVVKINLQAQTNYRLPVNAKPCISITIPENNWSVQNDKEFTMISPKGDGESSRLAVFIWGSTDPTNDNAIDDLTEESFDLISRILVDVEWDEEINEFEQNGISFVAIDGSGYFVNEDKSKDAMGCSVFLIMPDDLNIITLVCFGTYESHNKWGDELTQIILSMKPLK